MIKPQAAESGKKAKKDDTPHKLFYKIGEVSRLTSLEPYVLRYWETEFGFLKPRKGKSRQRMYQKKDIEILIEIKRLLYDERFTIEGVRKRLSGKFEGDVDVEVAADVVDTKEPEAAGGTTARQRIEKIKLHLRELQLILRK
ncbi:MerR family transcriptional regulator [Candidatus Magnetominusculus dajiuhuensis]|uniref:MerR family transcriptional regulator n=1 Tax=Candidatus Magnetominusculus dajiuhuensis TaxID=3137712 RepID=UPI003B4399E7